MYVPGVVQRSNGAQFVQCSGRCTMWMTLDCFLLSKHAVDCLQPLEPNSYKTTKDDIFVSNTVPLMRIPLLPCCDIRFDFWLSVWWLSYRTGTYIFDSFSFVSHDGEHEAVPRHRYYFFTYQLYLVLLWLLLHWVWSIPFNCRTIQVETERTVENL